MTNPHADLRAILDAVCKSSPMERRQHAENTWMHHAPALVHDLLEERDALKAEVNTKSAILREVKGERDALRLRNGTLQLVVKERDALRAKIGELTAAIRSLEQERDALKAEVERLRAHLAEPISDELRLRCELAAPVLAGLIAAGERGCLVGASNAHNYVSALLFEGRNRMAAERGAKP